MGLDCVKNILNHTSLKDYVLPYLVMILILIILNSFHHCRIVQCNFDTLVCQQDQITQQVEYENNINASLPLTSLARSGMFFLLVICKCTTVFLINSISVIHTCLHGLPN